MSSDLEAYVIPGELAERHIAIVGRTGSGKSHAAKALVELLIADGRRVCVVDPTGAWFGLRADPAGQSIDLGQPVLVLGGDHADVEVSEHDGAAVAEAVRRMPAAFVLDCSEMTVAGRTRFMRAFCETIYRNGRGVIHLILDECDELAPQNPMPETKGLLGAVERLVRRGRSRGFRCVFITQRPASLHKGVLSQAATLVAMRLMAPQDRRAVEAWIFGQGDVEAGKAVLAELPSLAVGEGFVWAPDQEILERVRFGPIRTYDSGRAPEHAADGPTLRLPPSELAAQLRELLQRGEEPEPHADDGRARPAAAACLERENAALRAANAGLSTTIEHLNERIERLRMQIARAAEALAGEEETAPPEPLGPIQVLTDDGGRAHVAPRGNGGAPPGRNTATVGAGPRLLEMLREHHPARFTWGQICTLAGRKARGGHFNAGRKWLLTQGYVVEQGEIVELTPAGLEAAGGAGDLELRTARDWLEVWCKVLPAPAPDMLRHLAKVDSPVHVHKLAAALGKQPRGGHWNSGLALLRNNRLIVEAGGAITLHPDAFRPT